MGHEQNEVNTLLEEDDEQLREDLEDEPADQGDQPLIAAEELTQQIVGKSNSMPKYFEEMQKESKRLFQQGLHNQSMNLVCQSK